MHEYGVFVRLEGSRIDALCHKSEVSDARVMEIAKAFRTGDRVKVLTLTPTVTLNVTLTLTLLPDPTPDRDKVIVTAVDGEKRRVSVSMKVGTSLGRYVEI